VKKQPSLVLFRKLVCFGLLILGLVWSGCGKKAAGARIATPASPSDSNQGVVSEAPVDLAALNQLLRKYVMWKKQIPKDLNELVTSGFVTNLPTPPAGKQFFIALSAFGYEVKLTDR